MDLLNLTINLTLITLVFQTRFTIASLNKLIGLHMYHPKGFTILEIVIVIAVIGILVGVMVPVLTNVMEEARISKAKSEVDALAKAILRLYEDTTYWPVDNDISTVAAWNDPRNGLAANNPNPAIYPGWKGPYAIQRIDVDPWGTPYFYDGGGRINQSERGAGQTCVMSYGPNRGENGSLNRADRQSQGDDIVFYFK